jgi:hypothetical protein
LFSAWSSQKLSRSARSDSRIMQFGDRCLVWWREGVLIVRPSRRCLIEHPLHKMKRRSLAEQRHRGGEKDRAAASPTRRPGRSGRSAEDERFRRSVVGIHRVNAFLANRWALAPGERRRNHRERIWNAFRQLTLLQFARVACVRRRVPSLPPIGGDVRAMESVPTISRCARWDWPSFRSPPSSACLTRSESA